MSLVTLKKFIESFFYFLLIYKIYIKVLDDNNLKWITGEPKSIVNRHSPEKMSHTLKLSQMPEQSLDRSNEISRPLTKSVCQQFYCIAIRTARYLR